MVRRILKARKFEAQHGLCFTCHEALEPDGKYAVLDRMEAMKGYTLENTRLICSECDRKIQRERGYT